MESCYAVEKELEKLLSKFSYIDKHTANSLQELLTYVDGVKRELIEGQLFSLQRNRITGTCIMRNSEYRCGMRKVPGTAQYLCKIK